MREHFASFIHQSPINLPNDVFQIALDSAQQHAHILPEVAVGDLCQRLVHTPVNRIVLQERLQPRIYMGEQNTVAPQGAPTDEPGLMDIPGLIFFLLSSTSWDTRRAIRIAG